MMNLKLISCEVFYREICAAVARSKNKVDVEFLPRGLHDIGAVRMLSRVREAVERVDVSRYDAIAFGYGLCNNGLNGLEARTIPLVIPRAHDCITLFLGSKERYYRYFQDHPGVYFKTSGWIERAGMSEEISQLSIQHEFGMDLSFEELAEKYGEENARFLYDELRGNERNYRQFTFIEMGVEPDDRFELQTKIEAENRGWKFEKIQGDMRLIRQLVDGEWNDEDFLVVEPGHRVVAKYDDRVITSEPVSAPALRENKSNE